jgi:hypothetical protein
MEFSSPIQKNSGVYQIPIQTTRFLSIQYPSSVSGSHTNPPLDNIEIKQYLSEMAALYEPYSLKWFNKKIPPFFFLQNLSHKWNHSNSEPYKSESQYVGSTITVHQIWCPEMITVQPKLFQISWFLRTSKYSSYSLPSGIQSEEIPYGENQIPMVLSETPRSIFHAKIRRAKMIAAIASLRVKKLYLKYYKRYGDFTTSGHDSPLSSDSEI